jgi:hypothetical protein
MDWLQKNIPQKIRFILSLPFLYPIVVAILLIIATRAFVMSCVDVLICGFNGIGFKDKISYYLLDRI